MTLLSIGHMLRTLRQYPNGLGGHLLDTVDWGQTIGSSTMIRGVNAGKTTKSGVLAASEPATGFARYPISNVHHLVIRSATNFGREKSAWQGKSKQRLIFIPEMKAVPRKPPCSTN